jgi:hypothetical protein
LVGFGFCDSWGILFFGFENAGKSLIKKIFKSNQMKMKPQTKMPSFEGFKSNKSSSMKAEQQKK